MAETSDFDVNIPSRKKERYRLARRCLLLGTLVMVITFLYILSDLSTPSWVPLVDTFPEYLPAPVRPNNITITVLIVLMIFLVVGSLTELENLDIDEEDIFLEKVSEAKSHDDLNRAIKLLDSAFSGGEPTFLPRSSYVVARDTISTLKSDGSEAQKEHAISRICRFVRSNHQEQHAFEIELETLIEEGENEEDVENSLYIVYDVLVGNVIESRMFKIGVGVGLTIIFIVILIFLSLTELRPVATLLATLLGGIGAVFLGQLLSSGSE